MILAFIAGAFIFASGLLAGAAIVQNTVDRVLKQGAEE